MEEIEIHEKLYSPILNGTYILSGVADHEEK